jgi:hypothetical protein
MAKVSEQLTDLSVRAKPAEDSVVAAKMEAHEKVMARRKAEASHFYFVHGNRTDGKSAA